MGSQYPHDFTENLEAVARGVRRLDEIRDPLLRDAIRAALGMPPERPGLDGNQRSRMRRQVLSAAGGGPRLSDRFVAVFTVLAFPAPYAVRALAIGALLAGALAGATVASADSLPDDALYSVKLAAEQFRLALAVAPADRAAVELSLAEHRLSEAERLASDGREFGALVATSAYAAHLASAAAELSAADELAPRAIALVAQLEARLGDQRIRAAQAAQRLMSDPRTAVAGVVLGTIATTPHGTGSTAATRVAEGAASVTSRLAAVAEHRAGGGQPVSAARADLLGRRRVSGAMDEDDLDDQDGAEEQVDTAPLLVVPPARPAAAPSGPARTAGPTRTPTTRPAAVPQRRASPRPAATPRRTATARPAATPKPTADPLARIAADKVKESAAKAKAAVEKTKESAKRTPSPKPTRTPSR